MPVFKGTQGKEDNQVTDATVVDVTVVVAGMVVVEKASTVLVLVNVVVRTAKPRGNLDIPPSTQTPDIERRIAELYTFVGSSDPPSITVLTVKLGAPDFRVSDIPTIRYPFLR
ncbi:hypothetical protein BKA93DRAFT_825311 [Sparassis latifolia]